MLQLKLYKNLDPKQPVIFVGRRHDTILRKLREWMEKNNGEWCDRNGTLPCQVDGLVHHDADGEFLTMVRDEDHFAGFGEWCVVVGDASDEPGDGDCTMHPNWDSALDRYIGMINDYGRFEGA